MTRRGMGKYAVEFITPQQMDFEVQQLMTEFENAHEQITQPPIPIDEIVELYLKLDFEIIDAKALFKVDGVFGALWVPIDHPGLKVVDRYAHGLTGNSFGGLEFDDMIVGPEHLLGDDGDGGKIFDEHFMYWRLMQAAAAIGCGESALDQMAERIQERHAFGGPIGRFTHLQQPIGEYLTKLRMAMSLAHEAAELIDAGDYKAASPLVNGLKAEGVEIALAAADAAMRAHGAMGYSREVDLGDRVRDLMGLRIADGTTDVMRMTVVKDKFGSELWKMAVYGNQSDASEKAEMLSPKP